MNGRRFPTALLLLGAWLMLAAAGVGAAENLRPQAPAPVYRIPLRVHLGGSSRPPAQWGPILEEINTIWLSQAGICFEIQTVDDNESLPDGLDLWFQSTVQDWNGYYRDPHDMHVRDNPALGPAKRAARSSAARTAAHELGHALHLRHRQDADDNLMRSKTYGWQLNAVEVRRARRSARAIALPDTTLTRCRPVEVRARVMRARVRS